MSALQRIQPMLRYLAQHNDENMSLERLARSGGLSRFHAHRAIAGVLGETPKQFALRLRLDRAAAMLISSRESILDIALACGFGSHEAFCRMFRKRFGTSPGAHRRRGLRATADWKLHAELVRQISPCVGLYSTTVRAGSMSYEITTQTLEPQPVLVIRRRVPRSEISQAIAGALPQIFAYAQQQGFALTGLPITRYPEAGWGMVTLEAGMRVDAGAVDWNSVRPDGEIRAEQLPGGAAAVALHAGPYEKLVDAYAAVEAWIASNGLSPAGAPWEAYLNDPGEFPNPMDWKTEVYWPVSKP